MPELPADLVAALDSGVLDDDQIRELIRLEAEVLGLGFDEAVKKAGADELPASPIGTDIKFLVGLLTAA